MANSSTKPTQAKTKAQLLVELNNRRQCVARLKVVGTGQVCFEAIGRRQASLQVSFFGRNNIAE